MNGKIFSLLSFSSSLRRVVSCVCLFHHYFDVDAQQKPNRLRYSERCSHVFIMSCFLKSSYFIVFYMTAWEQNNVKWNHVPKVRHRQFFSQEDKKIIFERKINEKSFRGKSRQGELSHFSPEIVCISTFFFHFFHHTFLPSLSYIIYMSGMR